MPVRRLIDHILVTPTPSPEPMGLEAVGNLAGLLIENPSEGVAESLIAEAGFELTQSREEDRLDAADGVEPTLRSELDFEVRFASDITFPRKLTDHYRL